MESKQRKVGLSKMGHGWTRKTRMSSSDPRRSVLVRVQFALSRTAGKKFVLGVLVLLVITGAAGVPIVGAQVPAWQPANTSGFGDKDAGEVSALAAFNGYLYAGTSNPVDGARIYRSQDGLAWNPVIDPGFGNAHDIRPPAILDLTAFNGRLYASTGRGDGPGQIWRAVDGKTWAPMVIHGFGDPDLVDITTLVEYNGMLYAGAAQLVSGARIYRSYSGDNNTWTLVAPAIAKMGEARVTGMAVFDGGLYAAVESQGPAQVWRSFGGKDWTTVVSNGFGQPLTTLTGGMAEFGGRLYVGAGNEDSGAQLWRTSDGMTWTQAITPGFGDPNNQEVEAVFVAQQLLYVSVKNAHTGLELWRSADGTQWEQANQDGFGDKNNTGTNASSACAEFLGGIYVGTANAVDGGEVWRLLLQPQQPGKPLYLPLIRRGP